jgi:hypothetical protein
MNERGSGFKLFTPLRKERGFGLAEIMIAAGIASVVMLALVKGLSDSSKSVRKIASSLDVVTVRARLTDSVSCRETFRPPGPGIIGAPGNPCSAGTYVELRSESGGVLVPSGGGRTGDWTVRAQCAAGGLDIRAAKMAPSATAAAMNFSAAYVASNFLSDEMGGNNQNVPGERPLRYDWDHPKGRLFIPGTGGLCADWFVPPAAATEVNCPAGQYMMGVDFMLKQPVCRPIPTCTGTGALTFDGAAFQCSSDIINRVAPLETRVAALEGTTRSLGTRATALEGTTTSLGSRVTALETGPASCQVVGENWYRGASIYQTPAQRLAMYFRPGYPAQVSASGCPAGYSLISNVVVDQRPQMFTSNSPQAGYSSWTETLYLRGILCCK